MRPINASLDSVINSTAFVAEVNYHNCENPSLVICVKEEGADIPTKSTDLLQMVYTSISCTDEDRANQMVRYGKGYEQLIGNGHLEEGRWKL